MALHLIPDDTHVGFIPRRRLFYALSIGLILASVALLAGRGLNFGIDFAGGIVLEVETAGPANLGQLRADLGGLGLGAVSLQEFGREDVVLIRIQRQPGGDEAQTAALEVVRAALEGDVADYRRTELVGPTVSADLIRDGIIAFTLAMLAILIYIWLRFEWQFSVAAIIALCHDVVITLGVFSLMGWQFDLSTVAAVLTIAGYSINDTVVVFDRVREILRKYRRMELGELFDKAINETLSRTVITALTTLLAVIALIALGGEVIRGFANALLLGVVIGTYSSICLAVPLLLIFGVGDRTAGSGGNAAGEAASGADTDAEPG
ncbi:MAG: protein translocase subunit SecF [Alphaproteobacteria bacterium]